MTTNKPEVVAWRWRKPVVNDQGETVEVTAWELGDAPEFLPWWTNEPLIRLSDYEALQAENALLLSAIRRLCNIYVVDDYYMGQLREERLEAAVNQAIHAATREPSHNNQKTEV